MSRCKQRSVKAQCNTASQEQATWSAEHLERPCFPARGGGLRTGSAARAALAGHRRGEQAVQGGGGGPGGDAGEGAGGAVAGPAARESRAAAGAQQPHGLPGRVCVCGAPGRLRLGQAVPHGQVAGLAAGAASVNSSSGGHMQTHWQAHCISLFVLDGQCMCWHAVMYAVYDLLQQGCLQCFATNALTAQHTAKGLQPTTYQD